MSDENADMNLVDQARQLQNELDQHIGQAPMFLRWQLSAISDRVCKMLVVMAETIEEKCNGK